MQINLDPQPHIYLLTFLPLAFLAVFVFALMLLAAIVYQRWVIDNVVTLLLSRSEGHFCCIDSV